jgi:hypothetical protein
MLVLRASWRSPMRGGDVLHATKKPFPIKSVSHVHESLIYARWRGL